MVAEAPVLRNRIVGLRTVRASELVPHEFNFRRHPEHQRAALTDSFAAVGLADRILAYPRDGKLIVIDGHLRREMAGDQEVQVLVVDLDDAEARLLLQAMDPLAALAETDASMLADLRAMTEQDSLDGLISAGPGLDELLGRKPPGGLLPGVDPDAIPEEVETRCKPGDLWALGGHRLLCGDATAEKDVGRLLDGQSVAACITDPPYNVGEEYDGLTNDRKSHEEYLAFAEAWWSILPCATRIVTPGCSNLAAWLTRFPPQAQGIWTKLNSMTRASASRFNCWEPILFWDCRNTARAHDVFNFPTAMHYGGAGSGVASPHPCPKPIGLWLELFNCYTQKDDGVLDPFCGSGTGLIAAQEAGRRCVAMDHSPHYCDIAVARWEAATGGTARLLESGSR